MEAAATGLSSLLATLRVDEPWTPPVSWEAIAPESGPACVSFPGGHPRQEPIYELASVTDDALVRLALDALYGVKSSLNEIEELSLLFSSIPADRTSNRVANVWSRSCSTTSVGGILTSIRSTGLAVFFLNKFVQFYLYQSPEINRTSRQGQESDDADDNGNEQHGSHTLINQAFASAVEKVLEGYFCSLNTLSASVNMRRSAGHSVEPSMVSNGATCDSTSEPTLLEVYLHTEELRRHVKTLGNICFPKFAGLTLCEEGLNTDANMGLENFPRGTDLLSYLYVHLRGADPVHYQLLKFLFNRSCEPYLNFIKSWIYRACVDDPYEEFVLGPDKDKQTQGRSHIPDDFTQLSLKGQYHVSAPCFLKEISDPLLRTGQQLQVLMKLLESCNISATGVDTFASRKIIHLEGVLPSVQSSVNSLAFSESSVEAIICQRDAMYKLMVEKLEHFFASIEVVPFDAASKFLQIRMDPLETSLSDAELSFGDNDTALACNMPADDKDNAAASTSEESSDKLDPLESSECSSCSSIDDIEAEDDVTACDNLSSSLFSSYCTGAAKGSLVSKQLLSSQISSVQHKINTLSPIDEHKKDGNISCGDIPMHSHNSKHSVVPDALELDYHLSKFRPLDRFLKNQCASSYWKMDSAGEVLYAEEQVSLDNIVYPFHSESRPPKLEKIKDYEEPSKINQPWNTSIPYNLSLNPMLKNATYCHTQNDVYGNGKNRALDIFDFESVTDPCEVYCGRSASCLDKSETGAATVVQSSSHTSQQPDSSSKFVQARSQADLVFSGEMSARDNIQENGPGGALWVKSLEYTVQSKEKIVGDSYSQSDSDMPLDIVIDKCIIQEVLLQYKYISCFTMKLLEDGFDLCEHLQALRRYHFMELADWADSFIISIYHKKWSFINSEQKRVEIQGLMNLALQRSSCDSDAYKDRLFIYMRQPAVSLHAAACGLDMLDDILLGYKADWPVNIVITEATLEIYAEIFCYLLQVRFAVYSLMEIWRFLKELTQLMSRSSQKRLNMLKKLNFVIKVRHQLCHFLSTLQQYLHCHLSDISWCRFQHSLKDQVRDMLDLEYVHLSYVTDALHICFLSDETKPIATIIKNMLQQALELRSCFHSLDDFSKISINELNSLHSLINFSQVDAIGAKFEGNIKELYILHSKNSKYGYLSRFWGYLNYNGYHSMTVCCDTWR